MAKEASTAPQERVNIVMKPDVGDAQEQGKLPNKIVMVGDYLQRPDDRSLEDRKPINIDKDNFNEIMAKQGLGLTFGVPEKLSGEKDQELAVNLKFQSIKDFEPEAVARQVPELNQLLELREALTALKGPMANVPEFLKKVRQTLGDEGARGNLMQALGMGGSAGGGGESG